LGDIAWTLDILFGRTDRMEVAGPPLRWLIDANWKLPVGNFAGDGHHLMTTHGFSGALGLKAKRASRRGYSVATANGHGAVLTNWAKETAHQPYLALASEVVPELERNLSAGQRLVLRDLQVIVGNVFPNMSFLDTASHSPAEWGGPEGLDMSFLTVRQWQPRGVGQLEVWSWLLLDKSAPVPWLEASTACYERVFGVAGVFEQDDTENWSSISSALRGPMARRLWADYRMGLGVSPSPEWIGQGQGYLQQGQFWEVNERNFYQRWRELMTRCSASG